MTRRLSYRSLVVVAVLAGATLVAVSLARTTGVQAQGGAIDGPGPVVANGMVLVNSGYTRQGGIPGNVLLVYAVP